MAKGKGKTGKPFKVSKKQPGMNKAAKGGTPMVPKKAKGKSMTGKRDSDGDMC